jgi:hypothetical protein
MSEFDVPWQRGESLRDRERQRGRQRLREGVSGCVLFGVCLLFLVLEFAEYESAPALDCEYARTPTVRSTLQTSQVCLDAFTM